MTQSETAIDPVCGMTVKIDGARHMTTHAGHHYYFCHAGCQNKFETDPQRYLEPQPEPEP
ncbi:MAG: YHS domain-containing protein, partial [Proteobacteria bacterium]|nr:YHS domain-containing protein [Pseudomonadota bacterium]